MKWVAFFSQTGSEIVNISLHLKRWPDYIITNNTDIESVHPFIKSRITHVVSSKEARTLEMLKKIALKNDLITLHGWLRIVPSNICNYYNIYNGHPGLITQYPELKGKDPQKRVFNNIEKYSLIGSVVHKVTPWVDEGEVVCQDSVSVKPNVSEDKVFELLKHTSLNSWIDFFTSYFKLDL